VATTDVAAAVLVASFSMRLNSYQYGDQRIRKYLGQCSHGTSAFSDLTSLKIFQTIHGSKLNLCAKIRNPKRQITDENNLNATIICYCV
jgi:hypothetical protein